MEAIKYLVNATIIVMEICIWSYFMERVMPVKEQFTKHGVLLVKGAMFGVLLLKLALPNYILNGYLSLIFTWAIYITASIMLYSASVFVKIIWYVIWLVCLAIPEAVILHIFMVLLQISLQELVHNILYVSMIVFIARILTFFLLKLISNIKIEIKQIYQNFLIEFILLIGLNFVILFTAAYLYLTYDRYTNNKHMIFTIVNTEIVVVLTVSLIVILKILSKSNDIIKQNKQIQDLKHRVELDTQIEISERNLRALRHNLSNTFGIIKGLLDNKYYKDLEEYMNGIYKEVENASLLPILNNKPLSALLYNKQKKAQKANIDFKSIISNCKVENIENSSLCAIMGNLWDNAIEAAAEAEIFKYVRTTIHISDGFYIIECKNSYKHEPLMINGRFKSRKEDNDGGLHGIGTENIETIVKDLCGELQILYQDNEFSVKILFPIKVISEESAVLITQKGEFNVGI